MVIPNLFRSLFTDGTNENEMLNQLCIQAYSSSLRCCGSLCKVQHDKLYNATHCKSKCAFTLAEVLITLVIIGVVAALTIPNLMQKYTEQATVKKVQKFHSNLANAYMLASKEYGPAGEWGLSNSETAIQKESAEKIYNLLFKPYFKIAKDCGVNNIGHCIPDTRYKELSGNDAPGYLKVIYYKIALEDNAAVWWRSDSNPSTIVVFYDTNGVKAPNQYGKDLFQFYITNEKIYPAGAPAYHGQSSFSNKCNLNSNGGSCAAWVVYKGNMDYLHCDGLTWESRSCKEK